MALRGNPSLGRRTLLALSFVVACVGLFVSTRLVGNEEGGEQLVAPPVLEDSQPTTENPSLSVSIAERTSDFAGAEREHDRGFKSASNQSFLAASNTDDAFYLPRQGVEERTARILRMEQLFENTTGRHKVRAAFDLSMATIATVLDAAGQAERIPQDRSIKLPPKQTGEMVFFTDGARYRFDSFLYPEFDRIRQLIESETPELTNELAHDVRERTKEALELLAKEK